MQHEVGKCHTPNHEWLFKPHEVWGFYKGNGEYHMIFRKGSGLLRHILDRSCWKVLGMGYNETWMASGLLRAGYKWGLNRKKCISSGQYEIYSRCIQLKAYTLHVYMYVCMYACMYWMLEVKRREYL